MKNENAMCNLWYFNYIPEFTDNLTDKTYYSKSVTLNSVRREIVSALTIVSYDKVRGRNKAQR